MKLKSYEITVIRAFCGTQAKGNPAGVILLESFLPDEKLLAISKQVNLSETAFLVAHQDERYSLRWFTPACEVKLCGHATLAAAFFLQNQGLNDPSLILFDTLSGLLEVRKVKNSEFEIKFKRIELERLSDISTLENVFNLRIYEAYQADEDYLLIVDEDKLKALKPDFRNLQKIKARGFIVTSRTARKEFHFASRFFAPACGIDEDAVTGSAHRSLAEYWSDVLGEKSLSGFQESKEGGVVRTRIEAEHVYISGEVGFEKKIEIRA